MRRLTDGRAMETHRSGLIVRSSVQMASFCRPAVYAARLVLSDQPTACLVKLTAVQVPCLFLVSRPGSRINRAVSRVMRCPGRSGIQVHGDLLRELSEAVPVSPTSSGRSEAESCPVRCSSHRATRRCLSRRRGRTVLFLVCRELTGDRPATSPHGASRPAAVGLAVLQVQVQSSCL
jgi:hypothetical protein